MDLSSGQHQQLQEMGSQTLESMLVCSKTQQQLQQEKKIGGGARAPQQEETLRCPRCDSANTKFCYYNNYSLTQPRYFCKGCRRYWTKGGTLRNVPVGGGCRKNNKRSSSSNSTPASSSSSASASKRITQDQPPPSFISLNHHRPNPTYDSSCTSDLTLAFARLHRQQHPSTNGQDHHHHHLGFDQILGLGGGTHPTSNMSSSSASNGFLDNLRGGFLETPNGYNGNNSNLYYYGGLGMNNVDQENQMEVAYDHDDHHHNVMSSGPAATTAVTVTTMKQEQYSSCIGDDHDHNNRVLWGNPSWQFGGDGNNYMGNTNTNTTTTTHDCINDSGREIWSGLGPSSWHGGLLNSPLLM